jgi:nucleotide-binding universal stress UspA family protein
MPHLRRRSCTAPGLAEPSGSVSTQKGSPIAGVARDLLGVCSMNAIASTPASRPPTVYLVAIDETASAVMVLDMACGLGGALAGAAELHIVHVVAPPVAAVDLMAPIVPQQLEATGKKVLDRALEHASSRFRGKIALHLLVGTQWREITQLASNLSADLVLVGTAGRTGLARVLLGSVAEQVVRHAGCPVLVIRPKEHHASTEIGIEPPCQYCLAVQAETQRATLWCERHRTHHPHGNLHYETPPTFAVGSMNYVPEG